jgi:putative two-component system response regulator
MSEKNMEEKAVILAVDDEPRNLKLLEAMLRPMGYTIITVTDGQSAVRAASEKSVDVVLLDIMMPGLSGFDTAKILKEDEATKTIPIVMVTALSDITDRVRALEAGADDFLTKPVDISELRARISSLLKVKRYNDYMKNHQRELEIEVGKRTSELRGAYEKIKKYTLDSIIRLTRASEYRDEDTGSHIMRMSRYSAAVAARMGLNENAVESILLAAPMHDIGKIGIPDRILLKPGKLTEDEWAVMKQHTVFGGKILEDSDTPILRMGEMIALGHHERWDGNGYPGGIAGKKIPLAARIVSIADIFDALTSKRPYKEPFTIEKSFDLIAGMKGSSLDPDVVDAFFSIEKEIVDIMKLYSDDEGEESMLRKLNESIGTAADEQ